MARIARWALVVILGGVAALLLYGGVRLIALGGSPYYVAAGTLTLLTALLLAWRKPASALAYSVLLGLTIAWSLADAGLDGWALAPRLLGPAVLGGWLIFLTARGTGARRWLAAATLGAIAPVALAGGMALMEPDAPSRMAAPLAGAADTGEWRAWGGEVGGGRHVAASQITPANVSRLRLAWRVDSDLPPPLFPNFEVTPLAADGRLYACLQAGTVVALEPETGRELWRHATPLPERFDFNRVFGAKCRGVSYFESAQAAPDCAKRVLFATPDGYLRAVDAATGRPCTRFGQAGAVDLHAGMSRQLPSSRFRVEAVPSSPPAIVGGVAVVGQTVSDLASLDAPAGVIRGFDAQTGKLLWAWNAEQPDRTDPQDAYARATPNAWGPMSGDEALGLVFVPLGNSPPDYFGGMRPPALDRFTTAIAALDVRTGKLRWSFQTVHHDLWDYDLAAQPVVTDIDGRPALLVPTKLGQIFVLDRRTGTPIDRVEERVVPQGGVPGERVAPTQPFTTGFPSLAGPPLRESDMWGMTPLDQLWCRIRFREAEYRGPFTPVTTRQTIMYPGTAGGINWGSVAIDPARGLMVVNALRFANFGKLVPRSDVRGKAFGGKEGTAVFEQAGTPWVFAQSTFMSPLGVPCQKPPYGTITAFDLKTRKPVWQHSFGTAAGSGPFGIATRLPIRMGVPNMGGSIVTASGLTFIAAAQDRRLRAYDTATGRELWSAELPAVGAATPMSFVSRKDGRQYVVIAAGGHYGIPGPQAQAILAFALPR